MRQSDIRSDNYSVFALCECGDSHRSAGKRCQDFAYGCKGRECAVISVADGHGDVNYPRSEIGACIAAISGAYWMKKFALYMEQSRTDISRAGAEIEKLKKVICENWLRQVKDDLRSFPLTGAELEHVERKYRENPQRTYGPTLLTACCTSKFWLALQLGDGTCVAVGKNGDIYEPIEEDKRCRGSFTTSISSFEAYKDMRAYWSEELPAAVFLGSDGIENSYKSKDKFHEFYRTICKYIKTHHFAGGVDKVRRFLPNLTASGCGDDVSVAAVVDVKALR